MKAIETGDGSPTLFSDKYGESFHSTFGAETESRYVFLEASGVQTKLESEGSVSILEIGFGLGLNALLSCDEAIASACALSYHSLEMDKSLCIDAQEIDFSSLLKNPNLASQLQQGLLAAHASSSDSTLITLNAQCSLTIHWGNATIMSLPNLQFDAIYLDAFSPDNNPECWTVDFFQQLKEVLASDGKLSTYCAKGSVRRALQAANFSVKKLPGPPGKREIMVASH